MFDFYKSNTNNELKVGYRLIFQSKSKTLSDEDIQNSVRKILKPILALNGVSIPGINI